MADIPTSGAASSPADPAQGTLAPVAGNNMSTPGFRFDAPPAPQSPAPTVDIEAKLAAQKAEYEAQMAALKEEAKKAKVLQEKLDEIEKQKLAEQGKYKELYEKELADRKKEIQTMRRELARESLRNMAMAEGIIDPDLVDMIPARSFQYDEETGRFTNLRELLDSHKASKPHLYGKPSAGAPSVPVARPTTGDPMQPPVNTPPQKKDISSLSRQEYEAEKRAYLRSLQRMR